MRSFASVRFKSSNSEGFGRTRKTRRGAFQAPLASFSPRILPTNTYIYIPVLEYHRIPYSKRFREDAEYFPLISAFVWSNTPRYSSLDIGGKIWHQALLVGEKIQNRRSLLLFEQHAIRTRERAFIPSSRENNNNNRSVSSWWCFFAAGESSRYSLDIKERSVGEKIQNWTIKSLGLRSL